MVDLQSKPHPLVDNFEKIRTVLAATCPAEFQVRREWAIAKFIEVGVPSTRDEEFKYLPLHDLNTIPFGIALGANVERYEIEQTTLGKFNAITLTFVNGEYAPELSTEQTLAKGIEITTLREILEADDLDDRFGKIASLAGKLGSTNDERFVTLNDALFADGAFVFIPKGTSLSEPIHIQYVSTADAPMAIYPRTLIVAEAGATLKVVESYVGLKGATFIAPVTEIFVGESANVEHVRWQNETLDSSHVGTLAVHQEAKSVYTSTNLQFGGKVARIDLNVWIDGEHTETWLNGTTIGRGEQILDNHTRIDHAKPNCQSFEVYKAILDDKATGVFNGKIFVYEDAQKTDAKQTNQAILLSPTATINTKPQLEIFADDVKCTHGATIGQLREDALFYLRARGIPRDEARSLLVYAFAAEVLDKVTMLEIREALESAIFAKLAK